jgi:PAS domain S-box-containing protein
MKHLPWYRGVPTTGRARTLYAGAGLTVIYFLLSVLGLQWATLSGTASPVFPAAGVALAGLALGGVRLWPAVLIGRWGASLVAGAALPAWAPFAVAAGNVLAAVAGAQALRWAGLDPALRRLRDVLALVGVAFGSSVISATIGSGVLNQALGHDILGLNMAWLSWWTGDVAGVLVVAPLLLSWARGEPIGRDRTWWLHAGLSTAATALAAWMVFGPGAPPLARSYLIFPALLWAALVGGVRGSSAAMVPVAALSVWGTTQGHGPFTVSPAAPNPEALSFLILQQFVGITAVSTLVLAVITDERRAKRALRRSEASFRSFFETPAVGVVQADIATGRLLRVNQKLCEILGYSREELETLTLLDITHPDDREASWTDFRSAVQGDTQHYQVEKRYVRKNGELVWARINVGLVRDADGTAIHTTAVVEDVTEQKRNADAVRESEQRLQMASRAGRIGVWEWNTRTGIAYWSPEACALYGREPDCGIDYEGWIGSIHPEDRSAASQTVISAIERARAGEDQVLYKDEYRVVHADGTVLWAEPSGGFERKGETLVMRGVVRDITERKAAEIERERLLQSERTARAEAERASRLKDEFLATISHELRTPLNAILGWAQILNNSQVDASTTAHGLAAIERNARSQAQLVNDLLDMSRIVSGRIRLDARSVDLREVIDTAVDTVRPAAKAKGIRIDQVLDPQAGPVWGDANRLQQVVWHLLSNAVKFTPNGGRVRVGLRQTEGQLEVTVADTGQGIDPDFLPFLYDHFRQADGSTTRQHGGMGLGLAIVKQLVEMHGGRVWAQSPGQNQGSIFTVELPLSSGRDSRQPGITPPPRSAPGAGLP